MKLPLNGVHTHSVNFQSHFLENEALNQKTLFYIFDLFFHVRITSYPVLPPIIWHHVYTYWLYTSYHLHNTHNKVSLSTLRFQEAMQMCSFVIFHIVNWSFPPIGKIAKCTTTPITRHCPVTISSMRPAFLENTICHDHGENEELVLQFTNNSFKRDAGNQYF